MRLLLRAWDRFFFSRFDPYSLALLRICCGLLWLAVLLCLLPNWERFFAPDGLSCTVDPFFGRYVDPWSVFHFGDGNVPLIFWWWFSVVVGIFFTIGWHSRLAAVAVWVMQASMYHRGLMLMNGEDVTLRMLFLWCMFCPVGQELSVDAWIRRRHGIAPRPQPLIWGTRMLQLFVLGVYVFSLPCKLTSDPGWRDGRAIYLAIIDTPWTKFPWPQLFYHHWVSSIFTWSTIAAEGLFPILVWFRRTRLPMLIVMTLFHAGIAICLCNVTFFSLATIASFWVFVPAETSRQLVATLQEGTAQLRARFTTRQPTAPGTGIYQPISSS